ncbi:MAG: hypothetical protein JNK85_28420 [Verrucomicrobiales bacterium]|nr:hypothetical protein [Verrucomicrobiales bacterium]
MPRILNTLLLLLAVVAQGVFAMPAGWRQWELADHGAVSQHTGVAASCRCCDCRGAACCAVPVSPRVPSPDNAIPLKPVAAPEGPVAPALHSGSGSWSFCLPSPDPDLPLAQRCVGTPPGPQAPAFLCGGGLLI